MDRRGFLGAMLAACAAPAIVRASSLMKVSGITIPTTEEVLSVNSGNVLLTPSMITREALLILEQNLVDATTVNRFFEQQFQKVGSILTIRKPNKFVVG